MFSLSRNYKLCQTDSVILHGLFSLVFLYQTIIEQECTQGCFNIESV